MTSFMGDEDEGVMECVCVCVWREDNKSGVVGPGEG